MAEYHGPLSPANVTQIAEGRANWAGTGCAVLGLSGVVDPSVIVALARGHAPDGNPLPGISHRSVRNACYDLTFAPHKSVSVAALVGGQQLVVQAHARAVETVLAQLEQWVSPCGTRGVWGPERSQNLTAAHIVHTHSRAGDPHLHSHLLLFNMTLSRHARLWRSIDNRFLFMRASVITGIYHQTLGAKLAESGFNVVPSSSGAFAIAAMPTDACAAFSKRRVAVVRQAITSGADTGRARRWINDAGRGSVKTAVEGYTVDRARWRMEAAPWLDSIDSASVPSASGWRSPSIDDVVELVRKARRELAVGSNMRCTLHALTLAVFRLATRPLGWDVIRMAIGIVRRSAKASREANTARVRSFSRHEVLPPGARPAAAHQIFGGVRRASIPLTSRGKQSVRPEICWPAQYHYGRIAEYARKSDRIAQGFPRHNSGTITNGEHHSEGDQPATASFVPDEQSIGIKASV